MKHLLNEMSEQEKDSIRQQHTGGIKVNTERFGKLIESKLGDVKPLISEQPHGHDMATQPKQGTGQGKALGTTSPSYVGKTVNLYLDVANKQIKSTYKITSFEVVNGVPTIKFDKEPNIVYRFSCVNNTFNEPTGKTPLYNKPFSDELNRQYCTKSSGGQTVPKADFASTTTQGTTATA